MRWLVCIVGMLGGVASPASAFLDSARFSADTLDGGGGGRHFTGSPVDGYTRGVCHGQNQGNLLLLDPLQPYQPGQSVTLGFEWPTAQESGSVALEIVDDQGQRVGALDLPPDPTPSEVCPGNAPATVIRDVGDRQIAFSTPCGNDTMRVVWTPPMEGGQAWLFASAVLPNADGTPSGDAVATVARPLPEFGAPAAERSVAEGSCAVQSGGELGGFASLAFLVLVVLRLRSSQPY